MNAAAFDDVRSRLHSTIGGSSETELKLLAVRPTSSPSTPRVVTTVTPVVNEPRALRNCLESMVVVFVMSSSLGAVLERRHHEAVEAFRFLVVRIAGQAEARAAD